MTRQGASRLVLVGFAAAFLVVHGVIAWLSPLQGDDWGTLRSGAGGLVGEWIGALVRSTWLHTVLCSLASALLVVGTFVLAMRRLPDPRRGGDVLGVVLVSCLLWIALPRAGAMWFHRSYVAAQVHGGAMVVWFLAAYRCRRALAGRAWPIAMALVGLAAGLASRQLAVMAVVGAAIAVGRTPRAERPGWMLTGLAGSAAGLVVGFVRAPWGELGRVFGRLEPNLVALAPLLRAGGPVIALIGLLWLATRLRAAGALARDGDRSAKAGDAKARDVAAAVNAGALGRGGDRGAVGAAEAEDAVGAAKSGDAAAAMNAGDAAAAVNAGALARGGDRRGVGAAEADDAEGAAKGGDAAATVNAGALGRGGDRGAAGAAEAGEALGWLGAWLGLGVAGLLGPRSSEATLLPAAVALTAGALPLLMWLAGVRWVRVALVALVIGVHAWMWTRGLGRYAELGEAFRERMAVIAATPRGQVATVRPYPVVLPDAWSVGEDWAELSLRDALAERWGLAEIELSPPFRQLERSPGVVVALEVDGVAPEVVAAAAPPRWPGDLAAARRRFVAVVARLRAVTGHAVAARLWVTSVALADRDGGRALREAQAAKELGLYDAKLHGSDGEIAGPAGAARLLETSVARADRDGGRGDGEMAGPAGAARLPGTSVARADRDGARGGGGSGAEISERAKVATRRQGRLVLAAWTDGAAIVAPEASRAAPDATSHMVISIAPAVAAAFDEAWQVGPGGAEAVRCATGRCTVAIERAEPTVLVLCNAERCVAVDAWVPRL